MHAVTPPFMAAPKTDLSAHLWNSDPKTPFMDTMDTSFAQIGGAQIRMSRFENGFLRI